MSQVQAAVQMRTVGRFTLIDRLGAGGQGEVWRVRDETADADLALKILDANAADSAKAWAALEREYAILALLRHKGILRVLPPERIEDRLVLPMELADGGNLTALRGMGYLQIVPVLLEVAAALGYAHARGVVHRDLKASNVLLDGSGQTKLADFGIAAVLRGSGAEQDIARACGGSPFSASPEQLRGEPPNPADDIYGFGALAYELLAGHQPYFPNFDAGQIQSGAVPQLAPARRAPVQLVELVMQMLAKRVDERPSSMHEVAEALELTLNATLALDLTELADLSAGPRESARSDTRKPPARPKPSATAAAVGGSAALVAPARAEVTPQGAGALPQPEVLSAVSEAPRIAMSNNPHLDEVSSLRAMPLAQPWERPGRYGGRRVRRHRGRFLTFGLICAVGGAAVTLWGSGRLSGRNLPRALSTVVVQLQGRPSGGIAHSGAGGPTAPSSPPSRPSVPSSGSLTARGVRIERRLNALAARGASTWDGADFAAAKRQVLEARTLQQTRGAVAARRHWHAAATLLTRLRSQAPRAATAQVKAGEQALAAGRQQTAARAFALALRIDGGSRQAAAGQREVHALSTVLPLLSEGRRAEQAGDYSRAAYYFRRVLARAPHYAPARAALTRVRRSFRDVGYREAVRAGLAAIAGGQLYHAQADFLQALVFRPEGIEAATELGRVNQVLYKRAPLSARAAVQQLGSD
jgi:serine/threonine protein kinase